MQIKAIKSSITMLFTLRIGGQVQNQAVMVAGVNALTNLHLLIIEKKRRVSALFYKKNGGDSSLLIMMND